MILAHYDVYAQSGRDAVRLSREATPHLVLMGLVMPHMDGLTAARALKSDPATQPIPVVLLTAHVTHDICEEARAAGGVSVLIKPLTPRQLVEEVRRLLAPSDG